MFVVESGSDIRLIEGLARCFDLSVLARQIRGGVEISQPVVALEVEVGPASRVGFARTVFNSLWRRRAQVDAVLVQGYGAAALAVNIACKLTGLQSFMLVCSPVERYYLCRRHHSGSGSRFRRWELLGLSILARLNAVLGSYYLVLSEHLAEVVRGHGGRRPVAIVPVYGVDTKIFSPTREPKPEIRKRLGLPAEGTLIFFSSRIAPEKDAETLLAAVRTLRDEGQEVWLLHRSGAYRSFEEDARRFGLGEHVIATDAVHPHGGLADDYRASDICVQASREEGLGFSPLEALACGVPVVASAVGGLRETIVEGQTGWSYPAGDPASLARCIKEVLANPDEALRRATNGRSMVIARYDRRLVFARLAQVIGATLPKLID